MLFRSYMSPVFFDVELECVLHVDHAFKVNESRLPAVFPSLEEPCWRELFFQFNYMRLLCRRVVADEHFVFDGGHERLFASEA